jgi:glycosyltransferase involved in cell wall biosynthesis
VPESGERPLVGAVTALGRPEYDLLHAAGVSLRHLADLIADRVSAAGGRALEWVVCCDSDGDAPVDPVAVHNVLQPLGLPLRVITMGGRAGPGPARNRALALVRAPYLLTLDSDDLVVPHGMLALLRALETDADAVWAAGQCYHVSADLELLWVGPPDPWPPGRVAPGEFWRYKRERGGLPFLCPAALARTDAVRACGGWPGGPRTRAEDTALWAVLTSRWPGVWVAEHVYDYRRHAASVTHSPGFRALDEDLLEIDRMVRAGLTTVY